VAKLLVLHGPNLNLLGTREPEIYGATTLAEIDADLAARASAAGHEIDAFQSNAEHELVDRIQRARSDGTAFIVINPGAFTHTSVAVLDALQAADLPVIEVHLSNIFRRESFRHHSYVSLAARGGIFGLGPHGYELALEALANLIEAESSEGAR